jgi:putative transposase
VGFIDRWARRCGLEQAFFLRLLKISRENLRDWRQRLGTPNQHNGKVPKAHQLLPEERTAILDYYRVNSVEGYRRLTYMMMDEKVAFVSPATTYRVLKGAGALKPRIKEPSSKGKGFKQPSEAHRHWHIDITYLKVRGIFYYLTLVLDGFSRYIVGWSLRESMTEMDVEITVQQAREAFPDAKPRIISDRGSQFSSRDFREFMRLVGLTHTMTSPYYPQSNGKLERCNKTIKTYLRTAYLANVEEAKKLIGEFVNYYNTVRLNSAIGYVAPADKLAGADVKIHAARDLGLKTAAAERRNHAAKTRLLSVPLSA